MSWWTDLVSDVDWGDLLKSGLELYTADKARGKATSSAREATGQEDALLDERLGIARRQGDIADTAIGRSARLEGRGEQLIGGYLDTTAPIRGRINDIATRPIDPNVEAGLAAADFAAADAANQGALQRRQARVGVAPNSGTALEQARLAGLDTVAGKAGAMTTARRGATDRELQRLGFAQDANKDLASLGGSYLGRSDTALSTATGALTGAGAGLRSVSDVYGDRANQAGAQAGAAGNAFGDALGGLVDQYGGKAIDKILGRGGAAAGTAGVGAGLDAVGSGAYANDALAQAGFGSTASDLEPVTPSVSKIGASDAAAGSKLFSSGSLANGVGLDDASGVLGGLYSLGTKEGKFAGTASAALSGYQLAGPWGALIGGIAGYMTEGGTKDMVPWDASGFSGITMDKAWQDQNLARLGSNPGAAVASKLGVKSNSVLGKLLDPSALFSKHGDEKRNMKAFTQAFPGIADLGGGKYALPDGAPVTKDQLEALAGTWYGATYHPDGDQEGWQRKFIEQLARVYGNRTPSLPAPQPGTGGRVTLPSTPDQRAVA